MILTIHGYNAVGAKICVMPIEAASATADQVQADALTMLHDAGHLACVSAKVTAAGDSPEDKTGAALTAVERMTIQCAAELLTENAEALKAGATVNDCWPLSAAADKARYEAEITIANHLLQIARKYRT